MEKTLKSQIPIKILTTANSNDLNKSSVVLIKANQIDTEKLVGLAEKANAKIHALVNYSGASDVLNLLQNLSNQGFVEGSYVFINIEDVGNINEIQSIYSNLRQGGYYVGLVNTVKGFASLDEDDVKSISFYKMIDQDGDNSITVGDTDGYINGLNIDLTGKLNKQPITRKERNTYTNVDVSTDSKGWVGIGQDTVLGGGKGFGYSTMGNDFNTVISPKGIIFRRPDAERMWELLKPKQQAEVSELLDHTVADEIKSATADLPNVRKQADEAVKFAESAIAASKVNSDAIVAQSEAISEAKAAADSAAAEIQQTKANAASDVAAIKQGVADMQTEIDTAKSANEEAVKSAQADVAKAQSEVDQVKDNLAKVSSDLDTYAKSAAEQGHDITVIKQKQGQYEADYASVNGKVNQLQADTDGLRENIKDNQGNIASLQTSASQASIELENAKSQVAKLQLTADGYKRTFADQGERLSKVEQTATEHTTEIADAKGNLSKVSQKVDSLAGTFTNAEKDINNIKLDVKGLHDTLTGQGNQLASLNVTLNSLDSKYSGITGDLQSKQTALSTEQQQTKDMLSQKADKSEVDNVKGTVSKVSAEQKVMADQISSKVSSADYQKDKTDTITAIEKNSTAIDENSKLISLMAKQTDVDNIKGTAQQLIARLDVMAGEVKSKVDETRVNNIVDGKGYATTSTVQSLVDQKAGTLSDTITELDRKIGDNHSDSIKRIQSLTVSIDGLQSNVTNYQNDTSSRFTQLSNTFQSKIGDTQIAINDLKDKTLWKSTDSVDLNNAVIQQKLFVMGGSNLPPGNYWWYVQVEPGYNSRIVQYAVSDRDNIHYSRQYDGKQWTAWSQGATESEITQLRDDINLRVKSGDLLSQINLTAHNTLIQSNKIYLDSSSVVFSGRAFIPSAAISELDADKLTFYGNGSKASIGASIAQYDQDKIKSTINLQYQGGFEIHSSNQLGSILTMHDNTVRLAVKSNGMANPNSPTDQYSGFYASTGYSLMNSYLKDGTTSGISIGSTDSGVNKDYRIYVYDGSNASNNLSKGISIGTSSRFDVYAGNSQLFLGPDKAELRGNDHATVHGNDHTFIEGGNQQIYMHNGEVNIGNPNDTGNATGVHFQVFGWASFNGYVEGMGWTTKSTLSSKTRIEKLDTEDALNKIMSTDLETYQYKTEVAGGMTKRHAGPIIDDVHDVAQYSTPDEFINERRTGRSDADVIGYLMGAVQELKKQLDKVKEKINYE